MGRFVFAAGCGACGSKPVFSACWDTRWGYVDVSCEIKDASSSPGDLEQRRPWLLGRADCLGEIRRKKRKDDR